MLEALTLLLFCQLVGEVIARFTGVPLPGPVIGMVLLFAGLMLKGEVPESLRATTQGILDHLSLLFVPAGVGVMLHLPLVVNEWLPIAAGVVFSTLITIAVTAWIMNAMGKTQRGRHESSGDDPT